MFGCLVVATVGHASFCIDNQVTCLQELTGQVGSCLQIAAAILLQVEHQVFHALCLQFLHALHELIIGGGTKTAYADITDAWANHIGGVNGMYGNLVALHLEGEQVLDTWTHNTQVGNGTFRTAQTAHNLLLRHLHASDGGIVHHHDTVAGHDTYLFRGTVNHGLDDNQRVLHHIKLYADALKRTVQGLRHRLGLLGCGISRVGVQFLQHAAYGILHQFVLIDLVHIECLHCHLCNAQFAQGVIIARYVHLGIA